MESCSALAFARSSPRSATAATSTKPRRRRASTCAGPMKPVPIMPALIRVISFVRSPLSVVRCSRTQATTNGLRTTDYGRLLDFLDFRPLAFVDRLFHGIEHGDALGTVAEVGHDRTPGRAGG